MSSSEDEGKGTKTGGRGYTINLQAFSQSRVRLETELRDQSAAIEILDTYCSDGKRFNDINPLLNPDGANPLLTELYVHNASGNTKSPWGQCETSEQGAGFAEQMANDGNANSKECMYGDAIEATSLPSPFAIHHWPAKSWRSINAYYIAQGSGDIFSAANWKKLTKRVKKWLQQTHKIWSKIVSRLPTTGMHLTGGLEMSNGVQLYNNLLHRYGHTHAQCLASLLRILANIVLLKPDPSTGKTETIRDYFSRGQRIARMARDFPAMRFPIAGPLLKVMILEGLRRSDNGKYGQMIINSYANDLVEDLEKTQAIMETVEGLRTKQIEAECAPTSLVTAEVAYGGSGAPRQDRRGRGSPLDSNNNPDKPCDLAGHIGHTNSQCRVKWGDKAAKYRGGRPNGRLTSRPNKQLCRFFLSGQKCPFQPNCKFNHSKSLAKSYLANFTEPDEEGATATGNVASGRRSSPFSYIMDRTDDESSEND
jgi:hypothetical protein